MITDRHGQTYPDPIDAIVTHEADCVLAVITGTEGPSYRPLGATMAVFADGRRVGTLSSGCIETDIALHAQETLKTGCPQVLRYGRGSPFMDIKLPCGGGLEITLLPRPDLLVLKEIAQSRHARNPVTLSIDSDTGGLSVAKEGATRRDKNGIFKVQFLPDLRFLVFGKGPEAGTFAGLVQSAGYPNLLLSPDDETLDHGVKMGCETRHLDTPSFPSDIQIDPHTAVVLFFHDHDWEPPILFHALTCPAFYIGAQGSRMSRAARDLELEAMGMDKATISRMHGPIGLVPSARDARTLAISVLAEVLAMSTNPA